MQSGVLIVSVWHFDLIRWTRTDFFYKLIFFIQRKCGIYHSGYSTTRACLFLQILGDFSLFSMNGSEKNQWGRFGDKVKAFQLWSFADITVTIQKKTAILACEQNFYNLRIHTKVVTSPRGRYDWRAVIFRIKRVFWCFTRLQSDRNQKVKHDILHDLTDQKIQLLREN